MTRYMVWDDAHSDSSDGSGPVAFAETLEYAKLLLKDAQAKWDAVCDGMWSSEHQFFIIDLKEPDGWSRFKV